MHVKMEPTSSLMMVLFFLALFAFVQGCFSYAKRSITKTKPFQPATNDRFGSSVYLEAFGNIYPLGYFSANLEIGNPPKLFYLDIETGSDFSWVQCDAPCTGCTKPPEKQYKPKKENLVHCSDPLCATLNWPDIPNCENQDDQCDYEIEYVDQSVSQRALVTDVFPIGLINGSVYGVRLAFGCGYDQYNRGPHSPPDTAGVLGLGKGKLSIVSQLRANGLIENVTGICISGEGGGFLFLGDAPIPDSGVSWTQLLQDHFANYSLGPAELLFDGKSFGLTGLQLIFDSGTSYTYLADEVYKVVNLIGSHLALYREPEDKTLPVCWKGPFGSIRDAKIYFKALALSFTIPQSVQFYLPPEAYLTISDSKNVCLGILNNSENSLGDINLIGDIFMQDKMVIYDNEKQQIGWVSANCKDLPGSEPFSLGPKTAQTTKYYSDIQSRY